MTEKHRTVVFPPFIVKIGRNIRRQKKQTSSVTKAIFPAINNNGIDCGIDNDAKHS